MDSHKKTNRSEVFKLLSTILSWTIFVILVICACFLLYYFIAMRVYVAKGSGYEPKFSLYTIISPSMVPNINVYDVVVDVRVDNPEDIEINDVITFNSTIPELHGSTITHRVIAINKDSEGNYYYQTKGDNNLVDDGIKVPFESIVGKVALRIPKLGNVQKLLATKTGWIIIITLIAVAILVKDMIRLIRERVNNSLENGGKFAKFLNRPVLPFTRKKLLTYTPKEEKEEIKNDVNSYWVDDEEIDLDDLPKLK